MFVGDQRNISWEDDHQIFIETKNREDQTDDECEHLSLGLYFFIFFLRFRRYLAVAIPGERVERTGFPRNFFFFFILTFRQF